MIGLPFGSLVALASASPAAVAASAESPVAAAEYKASKYDVNIEPTYDSIINWVIRSPKKTETRHLVTAYMPVPGDGSVTKVFTGPKDYFLLNQLSGELKGADGRAVSIIGVSDPKPR